MDDELQALLEAKDDRISEIFYYFESLTTLASGRTVGRKIGIVQETLLRKYFESSEPVRRRMYLEQFLEGRSGAKHKVEFSFHPLETFQGLVVGDEVPGTDGVKISATSEVNETFTLRYRGGRPFAIGPERPLSKKGELRDYLTERGQDIRVVRGQGGLEVDLVDRTQLLASIESKRVGAQRFSASDKLGAGIQTIEKAKQASLVAVDLDLQHNGSIKPLQEPGAPKKLISIVALGNGVHWTPKDRAVLGTFVDFTWLVKDSAIIRYAEFIKDLADEDDEFLPFFMDYFKGMTVQLADDFDVHDDDFSIITPDGEERTLMKILSGHIVKVDGE